MKNKNIYLYSSLLVLILFCLFSYLLKFKIINQIDFDTTVKLQYHLPLNLDTFFSVFSLLGSVEIVSIILLIIVIWQKKLKYFFIFIFFAVAHLAEILGKSFINHPGPPFMFLRYNIDFLFPSSYVQPGSSYPSGHSLRSVYLSVLLFYLVFKSKKLSSIQKFIGISLLTLFTLIMLVSRISLGEHWFSDVVGGSLLGLSLGILTLYIF